MRRFLVMTAGAIAGFVVALIVAVNVVITAGIDRGYEAGLTEIFEENAFVGVVTVVVLAAGPIVGALVARKVFPGDSGPSSHGRSSPLGR